MLEELIKDRDDLWLGVERMRSGSDLDLVFHLKASGNYLLHWGLARQPRGSWQAPPQPLWPDATKAFDSHAVQTPFASGNGDRQITLKLQEGVSASFLVFDLFCLETQRWENNRGRDYYLPLTELEASQPSPAEVLRKELPEKDCAFHKVFPLDSGDELAVAVAQNDRGYRVLMLANAAEPLALHWGVPQRAHSRWQAPSKQIQPPGTTPYDDASVETPFRPWQQLRRVQMEFAGDQAPAGLGFVLHQTDTNQWLKHRGQNLFIPIARRPGTPGRLSALAERIVEGEMGDHGWTLMHRFNLCHDLIDEIGDEREGWATLFVWLRYSAIRQLDWQRNYNTKPRELSHAQDRLTLKLAEADSRHPQHRDLIRLIVGCLGRGGDGQRIRDEVLHIMHRHHIKEVGGTWMEQWHQKLHNNTTPDDIVICEAYLAFLHGNGDRQRYHETLGAGGVSRERLASFDRPITTEPEWHPHLKDGLLYDFGNFLQLLKSVHSGTDLESAANAGGYLLDGGTKDMLGFVQHRFRDESIPVTDLAGKITGVRRRLHEMLRAEGNSHRIRDGLYLDLALEEAFRTVIERRIHSGFSGEQLLALIDLTMENLGFVHRDEELAQCRKEWLRLPDRNQFSPDWSLHAKAALDRLRRVVESLTDELYRLFQPTAESLGSEFQADDWAVKLFSEEIVRGRPVFVLSILVRHLDPILRKGARLGDWQVISPSHVAGEVRLVESLRAVQGQRFEKPVVLVAEKVHGDEEPPEGVRAVITPGSVDLVSHIAVRARNANLLFASCYDGTTFERLRSLKGRLVELKVNPAGDVTFAETRDSGSAPANAAGTAPPHFRKAEPNLRVLAMPEFDPKAVGGKSWHLQQLAGKLPDWVHLPKSVALPFGVFEAVLSDQANRSVAERFAELTRSAPDKPEPILEKIRACVADLLLPQELQSRLRQVAETAGLACPDWPAAAARVKQVWASKWNDRAWFSRRARNWPDDAVQMAVLIQEVVEAEYAFVIHTANPFNGSREELYAEVVLGLGETLVGNYSGRALGFVSPKARPQPKVLSYPAKSVGLFGGGLIFRSDSNAEDLEAYAGAGLYDSFLLQPPRRQILDYTGNQLVWDEPFREAMLGRITAIGDAVEKSFGSPQDIEGVYARGKYFVVQSRPQVGLSTDQPQ